MSLISLLSILLAFSYGVSGNIECDGDYSCYTVSARSVPGDQDDINYMLFKDDPKDTPQDGTFKLNNINMTLMVGFVFLIILVIINLMCCIYYCWVNTGTYAVRKNEDYNETEKNDLL